MFVKYTNKSIVHCIAKFPYFIFFDSIISDGKFYVSIVDSSNVIQNYFRAIVKVCQRENETCFVENGVYAFCSCTFEFAMSVKINRCKYASILVKCASRAKSACECSLELWAWKRKLTNHSVFILHLKEMEIEMSFSFYESFDESYISIWLGCYTVNQENVEEFPIAR